MSGWIAGLRPGAGVGGHPLSRNDAVGKGSATVPVALFGVSPNRGDGRFHLPIGAQGDCCRSVGGTPTAAVETTALPIRNFIVPTKCRDFFGVRWLDTALDFNAC